MGTGFGKSLHYQALALFVIDLLEIYTSSIILVITTILQILLIIMSLHVVAICVYCALFSLQETDTRLQYLWVKIGILEVLLHAILAAITGILNIFPPLWPSAKNTTAKLIIASINQDCSI